MSTKSLLEKARESARRARSRAHQRLMYGGQDEPIADYEIDQEGEDELEQYAEMEGEDVEEVGQTAQIKQAVEQAIQRARQSRQVPQMRQSRQMPEAVLQQKVDEAIQRASEAAASSELPEQEGGVKNMEYLRMKARAFIEKMKANGAQYIPSEKTVMNSFRSYVAFVDGKKLVKRYFHGAPKAAASKVLSSVTKINGAKTDQSSPIMIELVEVTKGVHKSGKRVACVHKHSVEKGVTVETVDKPGKCAPRYHYKYYAWREPLANAVPHTVTNKTTGATTQITPQFKNMVVPIRKGNKSLPDALAARQAYVTRHDTTKMANARADIQAKVKQKRATLGTGKRFPPVRTYRLSDENKLTGAETKELFKQAKKETKSRRNAASTKRATTMALPEWQAAHPKKGKKANK